jgi:putative heme-binding domain-containing protein
LQSVIVDSLSLGTYARRMIPWRLALVLSLIQPLAFSAPDGKFHPLVPGISAAPLPVKLPNCNNLLYRHDGKLIALGYAGDVYLLTDSDGDGSEDKVELFWENNGRIVGQIGMDLAPKGSPHGNAVFLAAKGKIVMLADKDGDDRAEVMQTLAEGWPPARAGVDVTGLTLDPRDGSIWFGLGVRLYNDAYEIEETGVAQNDLGGERGAIYRITPDFNSREKICTGIRWPIALRFNRHGDLFCTDQEGATWLPNGNPFDELLQIQKGRHYGFPPRHPKHLPNVIDEPSVYDYGPQHQSTCGMNFNDPVNGGVTFGPSWWSGDAFVAGESRGKIFRTKLVKTDVGYVAHNETIARLGMMIIDQCVSPDGELRFCTHSGDPDWGTGPKGKGQIWRVRYDDSAPQPVIAWRHTADEVRIAFDRPVSENWNVDGATIEASPNARSGDRFETMRPPYEVVRRQISNGRQTVNVVGGAKLANQPTQVSLKLDEMPEATWLSLELPGGYSLQANTSGVVAEWKADSGGDWSAWVPHVDLDVARTLTMPSAGHQKFARQTGVGTLTLRTQLNLWQMLRPAVQKDAQLDYDYAPEIVTVTFASASSPFEVIADGKHHESARGHVTHDVSLTLTPEDGRWLPLEIKLKHQGKAPPTFTAFWSTSEDRTPRALQTSRFLMPWAIPGTATGQHVPSRPEIRGGNWALGKALFFGNKALCSTCHQRDGAGTHIGPDLSTLPHRDYASVLHDLRDPSASINPDYPTQEIEMANGEKYIGVPVEQPDGSVRIGIGPGASMTVKKTQIIAAKPVATSLMPTGLDQTLNAVELRDLMTFLLTAPPVMRDYASLPRDEIDHAPHPRIRAELDAVLAGAPEPPLAINPIRVTLVAGQKDHGFGEHDYPRWQQVWSRLLSLAEDLEVSTAWQWPSPRQWENSDVLVFFKRGNWDAQRSQQLQRYIDAGGGAVFIHWACEAGDHANSLANVIGLASNSRLTKYRHGLIDLTFDGKTPHPITRGFETVRFHDESYWALVGDPNRQLTLATAEEAGRAHPLFWVRESKTDADERGRLFVSIPGHYSWTFDDPLFRVLLLRGIAWTAHEPVDRFNNLIEAGVDVK